MTYQDTFQAWGGSTQVARMAERLARTASHLPLRSTTSAAVFRMRRGGGSSAGHRGSGGATNSRSGVVHTGRPCIHSCADRLVDGASDWDLDLMTGWARSLVVSALVLVAALGVAVWSHTAAGPERVAEGRHSSADPRSVDRGPEQDREQPSAGHDWPWRTIPVLAVIVLTACIGSVRVRPVLVVLLRR
jgi:hypothetical protein